MTYCTVVEFEWSSTEERQKLENMMAGAGTGSGGSAGHAPEGRLSHITGIDDTGARMIEVWRSSDDARAFAEQSGPALAGVDMPMPSRVYGFEVTSYEVA
jgi:hypothetical protein